MKLLRFTILILFYLVGSTLFGQAEEYVIWEVKMDEHGSGIEFKAIIQDDWVIYSQHTNPEGPIPLEFEFNSMESVALLGEVKELTDPQTKMSEMFEVEVKKFSGQALFHQELKVASEDMVIKGTITYMTCNSKQGICYPPTTIDFKVPN